MKLPIVGRVSMDSCTVDATDLGPGVRVDRGSEFTFVGADGAAASTIEQLAVAADTNPQEILVGLDHRLPFLYRDDVVAA